jgi:hypothetical protein
VHALTSSRSQFESLWPRVQGAEAIYREWPHILHVRLLSAHWDDRLLLVQMEALPTAGLAQCQRPSAACGCTWDHTRCGEHGLCSFTWSLHVQRELIQALVERAAIAGDGWTRVQYEALSDFITDWELDRVEVRRSLVPPLEID